jgi:hypothetical protein
MNGRHWLAAGLVLLGIWAAFEIGWGFGVQQGEANMLDAFASFGCLIEDPTEGMKE